MAHGQIRSLDSIARKKVIRPLNFYYLTPDAVFQFRSDNAGSFELNPFVFMDFKQNTFTCQIQVGRGSLLSANVNFPKIPKCKSIEVMIFNKILSGPNPTGVIFAGNSFFDDPLYVGPLPLFEALEDKCAGEIHPLTDNIMAFVIDAIGAGQYEVETAIVITGFYL